MDNDPIVLAHARALLVGGPEGATDYLDADLRETEKILDHARGLLDFSQPVAVMLVAVLHLIGPEDHPYSIVSQLMDAVPPGSYLLLSHVASDIEPEKMAEMGKRLNRLLAQKGYYRSQAEVARVLHRARPGRARGRPGAALAAGFRDRGRPAGRHVGRRRPQARLIRPPRSGPGRGPVDGAVPAS